VDRGLSTDQSTPGALPRPYRLALARSLSAARPPSFCCPRCAGAVAVRFALASATQRRDALALCAERYEPRSCVARDAGCRASPPSPAPPPPLRGWGRGDRAVSAVLRSGSDFVVTVVAALLPASRAWRCACYLFPWWMLAPLRVTVVAALLPGRARAAYLSHPSALPPGGDGGVLIVRFRRAPTRVRHRHAFGSDARRIVTKNPGTAGLR
jgi:hypothetical protein